jgi:hypothetical protein
MHNKRLSLTLLVFTCGAHLALMGMNNNNRQTECFEKQFKKKRPFNNPHYGNQDFQSLPTDLPPLTIEQLASLLLVKMDLIGLKVDSLGRRLGTLEQDVTDLKKAIIPSQPKSEKLQPKENNAKQ